MAKIIFAFSYDTETTEGTFTGNIDPQLALQILQNLVIADSVQRITAQQKTENVTKIEPERLKRRKKNADK